LIKQRSIGVENRRNSIIDFAHRHSSNKTSNHHTSINSDSSNVEVKEHGASFSLNNSRSRSRKKNNKTPKSPNSGGASPKKSLHAKAKKSVNFGPVKTPEEMEQERINFLRYGITKNQEEVQKQEALIRKWKPSCNII
jgi:hypothetical protein